MSPRPPKSLHPRRRILTISRRFPHSCTRWTPAAVVQVHPLALAFLVARYPTVEHLRYAPRA